MQIQVKRSAGEKDDQRDHRKQKCDHQMCQEECQWIYQLGAILKSDHVCPGSQSHLLSLSDKNENKVARPCS